VKVSSYQMLTKVKVSPQSSFFLRVPSPLDDITRSTFLSGRVFTSSSGTVLGYLVWLSHRRE
jgi:hypothetical protein